jgi:hypothetical protein
MQARHEVGQQQPVVAQSQCQGLPERAAANEEARGLRKAPRRHRLAAQAPQLVAQAMPQRKDEGRELVLRDAGERRIEQRR